MNPEIVIEQIPEITKKRKVLLIIKTFFSIVFWLLIWLIAVIALWGLMVFWGQSIFPNVKTNDGNAVILLLVSTIWVYLFYLAVHSFFGRKTQKSFIKIGRKVLFVVILFALVGVSAFGVVRIYMIYMGTHNPYQDQQLLSYAHEVGAKYINDLGMEYADHFENNQVGQYDSSYMGDTFLYGEMKILTRQNDAAQVRAYVAHEYLHHIWDSKLDDSTKDKLTSQLINSYSNDRYMQDRLTTAGYVDEDILIPSELFSFYCTEAPDDYMTQYELDICNKYIDRRVLVIER